MSMWKSIWKFSQQILGYEKEILELKNRVDSSDEKILELQNRFDEKILENKKEISENKKEISELKNIVDSFKEKLRINKLQEYARAKENSCSTNNFQDTCNSSVNIDQNTRNDNYMDKLMKNTENKSNE